MTRALWYARWLCLTLPASALMLAWIVVTEAVRRQRRAVR